MLPHAFSHDGATYVVSFKPIGDQWRAALYKRDDASNRAKSRRGGRPYRSIRSRHSSRLYWAGAMVGEASSGSAALKRAHLDDAA